MNFPPTFVYDLLLLLLTGMSGLIIRLILSSRADYREWQKKIEDRVERKMDQDDCEKIRAVGCVPMWTALKSHRHAPDGKVTDI